MSTPVAFDLYWRDHGVDPGLRNLNQRVAESAARFADLNSAVGTFGKNSAAGVKLGQNLGTGIERGAAQTAKGNFFKSSTLGRSAGSAGLSLGKSLATGVGQSLVGTITGRAGAAMGNLIADKASAKLGQTRLFSKFTANATKAGVTAGTSIGQAITKEAPRKTKWGALKTGALVTAAVGAGVLFGRRFGQSATGSAGSAFKMPGGKGLGAGLGGLKAGIAGLAVSLGGGAIFGGLRSLANEASSLNETTSKSRNIFGASSKAIESWARSAAKNLGMSRQEALSGAAAFGNLFDQLGFGAQESIKMSKGFVKMATDAASFNDANPAEVMDAFLSATRGEYDALQRYIPTASAAAIEAEALRMGLAKTTVDTQKVSAAQLRAEVAQRRYNAAVKEHGRNSTEAKTAQAGLISAQAGLKRSLGGTRADLTAADKAAALYSLSMRGLGKAHGDFQRTGDNFANLQRSMAGHWADLRVQIGQYFLPIFERSMRYMNEEGFPALTRIVGALGDIGKSAGRMGRAVATVFGGEFATAIDGATVNLTEIADWLETHQETMVRFFLRLGHGAIDFGRTLVALAAGGIRAFGNMAAGLADFIDGAIPGIQGVMEGIAEIVWLFDRDAAKAIRTASVKLGEGGRNAAAGLRDTKVRAEEAASAVERRMNPVFDAAETKLNKVGNAEIWKAKQRDAAAKASIAIRDIGLKADGSEIKLKSWNDRTRLGAGEQARLERQIKTARARMIEQRETAILGGATQGELTKRWNQGRDALYKQFRQMGLSKDEAQRLTDKYSKVPKHLEVKHSTPGSKAAKKEMEELKRKIELVKSREAWIQFSTNAAAVAKTYGVSLATFRGSTAAQGGPRRAAGGPIPGWSPHPRADNIPVMATAGEWMHQKPAVDYYGQQVMRDINERRIPRGVLRRAVGGPITRRSVQVNTQRPDTRPVRRTFDSIGEALARTIAARIGGAVGSALRSAVAASQVGDTYTSSGKFGRWSAEQMRNAAVIASVGSRMGRRAQTIGIATAIVESGLRNLGYGDRDSVGLFQQRTPWGPRSVRMNPRLSAGMFFHGGRGGQRGLDDINWRRMSMGAAAQAVQVSAFPGRYAQQMGNAARILGALSSGGVGGGPFANIPAGGRGITGAIRAGRRLGIGTISTRAGHHPSEAKARDFMTSSKSQGDRLASVLWANRKAFGIWYLIWWRRIISMTRPGSGWVPYRRSNPHTDHVHASFYDRGGRLRQGAAAINRNGGVERVLSDRQNRAFERMVHHMDRGGGAGNTYIVNLTAPNFVGNNQQLIDTMVQAARTGKMDVVFKKAGVRV